jgi:16S rRNA (guanine(966)-N(2))-methyltransferase RsmD
MRVIAGTAKGTRLRPPSSGGTRPITDRAKEALFSILMPRVPDARFLDLFAGTGGVAIEALSRGARHATLVELDRAAIADLTYNLERTRLADRAQVVRGDVFAYLARPWREPFDIVFLAPPQWQGLWDRTMRALDARPDIVAPDGIVVVQLDPKEIHDVPLARFERYDERRYSNVAFLFHARRDDGDEGAA